MMTLSIRQPYAELIASGQKTIEIRCWRTNHRGPLLIAAGQAAWSEDMAQFGLTDVDCPRSVAVCVVDLVDVRRAHARDATAACSGMEHDDLAWVMANPRRVKAFYVKGRLRLFPVADTAIRIAP